MTPGALKPPTPHAFYKVGVLGSNRSTTL